LRIFLYVLDGMTSTTKSYNYGWDTSQVRLDLEAATENLILFWKVLPKSCSSMKDPFLPGSMHHCLQLCCTAMLCVVFSISVYMFGSDTFSILQGSQKNTKMLMHNTS